MKKVLVFTDSRGQHKPPGSTHMIFGERLKYELSNYSVDLVLCPMKWTTIIDFVEYAEEHDLSKYDYVVLFLGIVDWSPRPVRSALESLYNNGAESNLNAWSINTRDYSKKIVNNKKKIFDRIFGEKTVQKYLSEPFDVEFEGEKTVNMYSVEMAKRSIQPILKDMSNLIFINSNRVLKDWEGDFKRGRPKNISMTHEYSDAFSGFFSSDRLIDIRTWDEEQVKKFTCDNMHLSKAGSDYIFDRVVEMIGGELKSNFEMSKSLFDERLEKDFGELLKFKPIERFTEDKAKAFVSRYTSSQYMGTLIIGFRIKEDDPSRQENLKFLIKWIKYFYSDMFDILLVEQDERRKFFDQDVLGESNVRYEFLYNPMHYNRGWGYNVAVKHFCKESDVVVLMDTDVLPGSNFVAEIRDCLVGKYKIISPYQNVYYTDSSEAERIVETFDIRFLSDRSKIKNPVTITGGVVIFDKNTYLDMKGFEQYLGYGCEDRSLDVLALEYYGADEINICNAAYIHMYHPNDVGARDNFKKIYSHLVNNYRCQWSPELAPDSFIHRDCEHVSRGSLTKLLLAKQNGFADINLYSKENELEVNGVPVKKEPDHSVILPPDFKGLQSYGQAELYDAPDPDSQELEQFRNAYLGERCFIIGNGPSLNKHDLSLLENEYTFGVNSFYYKTKETGFRPTFYVVEDSSVMKENLPEIKKFHAPFKFFPTVYKRLHPKAPNTYFFKMNRGFYEKSSPNYCVPRFSTDPTKVLYCGQSVTYINLQLAYFMGFSEVYLIGMDFSYVIPKSHKRSGDVLTSDSDDPNHFHKDYFGKGKTWKDPKLDRVGNNYRMARNVFESVNRRIYNATVGGSLEIFQRVDYNSLFSNKTTSGDSSESEGVSFQEANVLFREGRYADASVNYLSLAKSNPDFPLYAESAVLSHLKAVREGQPVQREICDEIQALVGV